MKEFIENTTKKFKGELKMNLTKFRDETQTKTKIMNGLRMLFSNIQTKTPILTMLMLMAITLAFSTDMTLIMGKNSAYIKNARGTTATFVEAIQENTLSLTRGVVIYGATENDPNGQWSRLPNERLFDLHVGFGAGVQIDRILYPYGNMKQFWFYTSSGEEKAPYVYDLAGRRFSFMFDGAAMISPLNFYINQNQHLRDSEINTLITASLTDGPSPLIFAVLLMHIKEADWDIARGLSGALAKNNIWTFSTINFVFSDGFEAFAYRGKEEGMITAPGLYYTYLPDGNHYNAVITTRNDIPYTPSLPYAAIGYDELLYMPVYGKPIIFKDFSTNTKTMVREYHNTSKGNWHSTPVLPANGVYPNHEIILNAYEYVREIEYKDGYSIYFNNYWEHYFPGSNPPLADVNLGMIIQADSLGLTNLEGELLPIEPYSEIFTAGSTYWVTYNLSQEQCVRAALGPYLPHIRSVRSDDWSVDFYRASSLPGIDPLISRPMIFGKTYKITLTENADPIANFQWTDSRTRAKSGIVMPGEFFTFEYQREFEIIDILDIGIVSSGITELGVFAGDTCVGSVLFDGFPLQIFAYTQGYENEELNIRVARDRGRIIQLDPEVEVYDDVSEGFIEEILVAGNVGHAITIMSYGRGGRNDNDANDDLLDHGVYPNPFNPETTINFNLSETTTVAVDIYNIRGQKINTLFNGILPQGSHTLRWDGTNEKSNNVSSGIYFYRISTDNSQVVGRMILMK
ncbi:MAG: T9SS type A sorting domain-containing protein [Candidatus Cloacimonetes bacterium]|nr:T9SS type A sorting domain-containing protein [Candidatus Cloacimonadota bacterium]